MMKIDIKKYLYKTIADWIIYKRITLDISDALRYFKRKNLERRDLKCLEGVWNENISWEFYLSNYLPERALCSAVFALLKHRNKIVLTKTHRGWEMPGGHIENDETIEDALQRELLEEAGASHTRFKYIGYRKIIAKKPVNNNKKKVYYPFPVSYIPHYVAVTDIDLVNPSGDPGEVLGARKFSINEIKKLKIETGPIINICFKKLIEIN